MERLTDKKEADAQRKEYEIRIKQGYPRNIPEERFLRLAAYEDTGLEPDQVAFAAQIVKDAFSENPYFTERLRELAQADREGRVQILPDKSQPWVDADFVLAIGNALLVASYYEQDCQEIALGHPKDSECLELVPIACNFRVNIARFAEELYRFGFRKVVLPKRGAENA